MKLKSLTKEELERLPYDDIAFSILTSYGKKMKIQTLFKKKYVNYYLYQIKSLRTK